MCCYYGVGSEDGVPRTSLLEVGAPSDNASSRPQYHTDSQQLPHPVDSVETVEVQVRAISTQTWWLATGRKLYNARSWKLWRFDSVEGLEAEPCIRKVHRGQNRSYNRENIG